VAFNFVVCGFVVSTVSMISIYLTIHSDKNEKKKFLLLQDILISST